MTNWRKPSTTDSILHVYMIRSSKNPLQPPKGTYNILANPVLKNNNYGTHSPTFFTFLVFFGSSLVPFLSFFSFLPFLPFLPFLLDADDDDDSLESQSMARYNLSISSLVSVSSASSHRQRNCRNSCVQRRGQRIKRIQTKPRVHPSVDDPNFSYFARRKHEKIGYGSKLVNVEEEHMPCYPSSCSGNSGWYLVSDFQRLSSAALWARSASATFTVNFSSISWRRSHLRTPRFLETCLLLIFM